MPMTIPEPAGPARARQRTRPSISATLAADSLDVGLAAAFGNVAGAATFELRQFAAGAAQGGPRRKLAGRQTRSSDAMPQADSRQYPLHRMMLFNSGQADIQPLELEAQTAVVDTQAM